MSISPIIHQVCCIPCAFTVCKIMPLCRTHQSAISFLSKLAISEIVFIQVTTDLAYSALSSWNLTCLFADHTRRIYNQPFFSQSSQNIQANNTYMFQIGGGCHSFQINMSPKTAKRNVQKSICLFLGSYFKTG